MIGSGSWPATHANTASAKISKHASMLPPGQILGQRYEILQILGEGRHGAVYKARDVELNRMVASEVIRAGAGWEPGPII